MNKFIVIEANQDSYDEDGYGSGTTVDVLVLDSTANLAHEMGDRFACDYAAMTALLSNVRFVQELRQRGFLNIEEAQRISEGGKPTGRLFVADSVYRNMDLARDLDKIGGKLASDRYTLLQELDKNCLKDISKIAYKDMCAEQARVKSLLAKQELSKKKNAERRKQKKIANAIKALQEEGMEVESPVSTS